MKTWIPLALAALTACAGDYKLSQDDDHLAAPGMVVSPHQLDFYEVSTGETEVRSFEIANQGNATLDVSEVEIQGASAFSVLTPMPQRVQPDEAIDVEIAYTPLNTEDQASALIHSDDPDAPTDTVELIGTWAVPQLEITPTPFDFGDIVLGCTDAVTLTLANVGSGDLVIDEILHTGEGFEMSVVPATPLTLPAGASTTVDVEFTPEAVRDYGGSLWVQSNDPGGTKEATQTASGSADGVCVTVEEGGEGDAELLLEVEYQIADVGFLIDTTGSMSSTANAVANEFASISATLNEEIPDITFGVATFEDYDYGGMGTGVDLPFTLHQQQTSDFGAVQGALNSEVRIHDGADSPEATMEALYQALTGQGYDQDCDATYDSRTDVLPFFGDPSDPFDGSTAGTYDPSTPDGGDVGGMGFREHVLPIIIFATDAELRDPDIGYSTPGGCPADAGSGDVLSAANALGARLIGVGVGMSHGAQAFQQMTSLAAGTGSTGDMDGDGTEEAAVVTWNGSSAEFRDTVVGAVEGLIGEAHFDEVRLEVDGEDYGMVASIDPQSYTDVDAGDPVSFSVHLNGEIAAGPSDQTYEIHFVLIGTLNGDDVQLDTATIYVMVPGS